MRIKRMMHIGVHNSANSNAGDTLLFPVVRAVFEYFMGNIEWELKQAWDEFSAEDARKVNQNFDGVVIGGGGLLLRDQAGSDTSNSGWQWNSTVDAVKGIDIPLLVFAIGYNRFRGQADFDDIFSLHINEVFGKATFASLRNSGSIESMSQYLPREIHQKLIRQLCPTTVLWQLYPEFAELATRHDNNERKVFVLNAAFDREEMRFGDQKEEILTRFGRCIEMASRRGWESVIVAHKEADLKVIEYFEDVKCDYRVVDLTNSNVKEILLFYAQTDFILGMRGHAQMIPFGLRRQIMSIISHNKMQYFLEDINCLEWGVEVNDCEFVNKVERRLVDFEKNGVIERRKIRDLQEQVWGETQTNFAQIKEVFEDD